MCLWLAPKAVVYFICSCKQSEHSIKKTRALFLPCLGQTAGSLGTPYSGHLIAGNYVSISGFSTLPNGSSVGFWKCLGTKLLRQHFPSIFRTEAWIENPEFANQVPYRQSHNYHSAHNSIKKTCFINSFVFFINTN